MGNQNNRQGSPAKSRRWFLSLGLAKDPGVKDDEMVKMLTADGKLVTIQKSQLEKVSSLKKSSNKEILEWMNNPSKKEGQ